MKRSTFSILFYIKRSKLLKNGKAPIYMKITVNGRSSEISLKRNIEPRLWDTTRNQAKGNSDEAQKINEYLTSLRGQIFIHQRQMQEAGTEVSASLLRNAFLGLGNRQWTIVQMYQDHNDKIRKLVGKEYSTLTLQRYDTALKHITGFCKYQYGSNDLGIKEVNSKFISGFEFYLKTTVGCQHNSAMKHMKSLKKIIRIALAHDYIRKDPFVNYQITQKRVDRGYLTEAEIDALIDKEFDIKRITIVRDLFIFQCFTGIAYTDLARLSPDHLQQGIDKQIWLFIKRAKTGSTCHIPLLPRAKKIIDKYDDHPCRLLGNKLFPVPSNQKMNAYLKEVADMCGINKNLHTHLARHTYATTITLSNGVTMETVSKLLGHTKLQTTQIYAKVLDSKISEEINNLKDKLAMKSM